MQCNHNYALFSFLLFLNYCVKVEQAKLFFLFKGIPCLTNGDGPQINQPCLFPWQFDGKWYSGCTTEKDPDGKFWCSTKLDKKLNHISGEGNWGICSQSCISSGITVVLIGSLRVVFYEAKVPNSDWCRTV